MNSHVRLHSSPRIAFIGNSLPRRCGIATFTTDLREAVANIGPASSTMIVALTDAGAQYDYPDAVKREIHVDAIQEYRDAAEFINAGDCDVVSLQHEFGIFGGPAGAYILDLVKRLTKPLVTTFHTILERPDPDQRRVFLALIEASATLVVMADKGRDILMRVYGVPSSKVQVIPHGIPDVPFAEPEAAKIALGLGSRPIVLTFGLLSPNKGIEFMIDAMPKILQARPDTRYIVLGATHPNLVKERGETYREQLKERARTLGVADSVVFLDRFVDLPTLLQYISACDVYVTPYLDRAQMTSGTLAYSFGLGRAVVSTPYWHAEELLSDDRGVLVPFSDADALALAVGELLTNEPRRRRLGTQAYAISRSMTWLRTATAYLRAFAAAHERRTQSAVHSVVSVQPYPSPRPPPLPEVCYGYLRRMSDDTGLLQHAIHDVPDRLHGYCVDDNARALLLLSLSFDGDRPPWAERLQSRYASFVQHAWNPDRKRFRNFMGFDRTWLEDVGSEDSHGRVVWALGTCAANDPHPPRRNWAAGLLQASYSSVETFSSPRAWAFALLGLAAARETPGLDGQAADRTTRILADRLLTILAAVETPGWAWFENRLSYDNARLCEALIATGATLDEPRYSAAGLRTLRWLMAMQSSPSRDFRPVGSEGFHDDSRLPRPFDQQPLEAAASISACLAAFHTENSAAWTSEAHRAFAWFTGQNDLSISLVDPSTGSCRDGLHPDRANENCGGESVVSYLSGLAQMRRHVKRSGATMTTPPRAVTSR